MRTEIHSAVDFLIHLMRRHRDGLTDCQLDFFEIYLCSMLRFRYLGHWFPDRPNKGSGYRCLRINGKMDPVIAQAGAAAGLPVTDLLKFLPSQLTIWIDPAEVSYRIGENGSICVLYEAPNQPRCTMMEAVQYKYPCFWTITKLIDYD